MDKTKVIFNNQMSKKTIRKANRSKNNYIKKFGDDSKISYVAKIEKNEHIGQILGVNNLNISYKKDGMSDTLDPKNGLIVGNIRMGFGHYRISMAIASAAHSMGYIPYWMDLNSYDETTCTKMICSQNKLYSMGSRISTKSKLFNKFIWEPLNYEGFRKISFNAINQKNAELMVPVYKDIPKDMPFVATHVWSAQGAIHAGMKNVVNVIPDNWPMALHLSQGCHHTVQTHFAYQGYRTLNGMNGTKVLNPMSAEDISYTGHYVDHEMVSNIELDCLRRIKKNENKEPVNFLLTIGGAGAQKEIFIEIIRFLLPYVKRNEASICINIGDYIDVWKEMENEVKELKHAKTHFNQWEETISFANRALTDNIKGIHGFYHKDIYEAVYTTNLLMRSADVLVTKPSELAFYPVPKLFIKRVGGHEQWGAIHSAEIGDGTLECRDVAHTKMMIKMIMKDKNILNDMNNNIMLNKKMGIYDGAYKVVEIAMKNR